MNKDMYKTKKQWLIVAIWTIGLCGLLALGIYLFKQNAFLRYQYKESKKIELSKKIYTARQSVYKVLHTMMIQLEKKAEEFNNKDRNNIQSYLTNILKAMPSGTAAGIAFHPYVDDNKATLHASYMVKNNNEFKTINLQQYYNYLDSKWYRNAFGKKLIWQEPFLEASTNTYVLRLSTTIYQFDPTSNTRLPIAVLFIDISQSRLNVFANSTIYSPNTYAFIISSQDTLISYPIESYVTEYQTLFNISRLPGKKDWHRISTLIKEKHGGLTTYQGHENYWVAFEPLSISNWFIVYVTAQESLFNVTAIRHNIMHIAGLACILLLYIYLLLMYLVTIRNKKWLLSGLISVCFFLLTSLQLYLNAQTSQKDLNRDIIKNKIDLSRFKQFQTQRDKQLKKPNAIYVPTGIIFKNILLLPNNKLELQGFIWQQYKHNAKNIKKDINFFNAEKVELKELYQQKNDNGITIGWSFHIILNITLEQSKYPFNILNFNISFYHPNLEKNIILTPDFDSYDQQETEKNIGISNQIILEQGLKIKNSYFFYTQQIDQSSLGLTNAIRKEDFPDLSFEANMQQGIVNPLIAYLLPLSIISLLLFYILLLQLHLSDRAPRYSWIDLLGQTGAIFLTLVLSHNALRSFLQISTIAYLESYYFIIYVVTFLIASDCIMQYVFGRSGNHPLKILHNNLAYLYWPFIMQSVFIITLYFFY